MGTATRATITWVAATVARAVPDTPCSTVHQATTTVVTTDRTRWAISSRAPWNTAMYRRSPRAPRTVDPPRDVDCATIPATVATSQATTHSRDRVADGQGSTSHIAAAPAPITALTTQVAVQTPRCRRCSGRRQGRAQQAVGDRDQQAGRVDELSVGEVRAEEGELVAAAPPVPRTHPSCSSARGSRITTHPPSPTPLRPGVTSPAHCDAARPATCADASSHHAAGDRPGRLSERQVDRGPRPPRHRLTQRLTFDAARRAQPHPCRGRPSSDSSRRR